MIKYIIQNIKLSGGNINEIENILITPVTQVESGIQTKY